MYKIVDHYTRVYRYRWDRLAIATLPFYFLLSYKNKPQTTTPYMYIHVTSDMHGLFGASLSSQRHRAVCQPWMLSGYLAYTFTSEAK